MPAHSPLPLQSALTFGIELEFLLAAIPLEDPSLLPTKPKPKKMPEAFRNDTRRVTGILDYPHPKYRPNTKNPSLFSDRNEHEYAAFTTCIAESLTAVGVPASPFYLFPEYAKPTVADASGVRRTWEVKRDTSVYTHWEIFDPENFFKWQSVELASPVFYSVEEAFIEVRKVCEHLTSTYRVLTNETCGLHVHVGNCSSGFDLGMLKRLMANLWTWEPQIHVLHPYERTSSKKGSAFAKPLRPRGALPLYQPWLDPEYKDVLQPSNHEALAMIYGYKSTEELIYWLSNPETYNAYKMENLLSVVWKNHQSKAEAAEQLISSKRTIEFRQHEGTLDADRIICWAKLAIGFIDKARWMDPDHAMRKILDQLDIENAHPKDAWGRGLEEMLADVGGKEVEDFYLRWLGKEKEWLEIQLNKRELEAKADAKRKEKLGEDEKERTFRTAVAELKALDRSLAKLEAQHLRAMDTKLAKLDEAIVEVELETRGRSTDPKACTATTNLRHGSNRSKIHLIRRAAAGRFNANGFRRA